MCSTTTTTPCRRTSKLLGQINSAYSLLRHVPVAQFQEKVKAIAATLRAAECPAHHHAHAAAAQAQDDDDESEQENKSDIASGAPCAPAPFAPWADSAARLGLPLHGAPHAPDTIKSFDQRSAALDEARLLDGGSAPSDELLLLCDMVRERRELKVSFDDSISQVDVQQRPDASDTLDAPA